MAREVRTNYSHGYVVEFLVKDQEHCLSWLLLPAENLWPVGLRCFLYVLALVFMFLGIAIASDVFMSSIEVITSKTRTVFVWDEEKKAKEARNVLIWNETVANLTLMALGSSAPEILLATCEMISEIDNREAKDALGTFTIIGSAAFNLLIITAVCVLSVPTGEVKSIKEQGVFVVTAIWSIWAYVWMLLVVKYVSPGQIEAWEAWVTLGYMPVFVGMAYVTDRGWLTAWKRKVGQDDQEVEEPPATRQVQVELPPRGSCVSTGTRGAQDEIGVKFRRRFSSKFEASHLFARARFRHTSVSVLMGSTNFHRLPDKKERMADMINKVKRLGDAMSHGADAESVREILRRPSFMPFETIDVSHDTDVVENLLGKFSFSSDRYAVISTAQFVEVDILFHRWIPSLAVFKNSDINLSDVDQGSKMTPAMVLSPNKPENEDAENYVRGSFYVNYETHEGSAKKGKDFVAQKGTLHFVDDENIKILRVSVIPSNDRVSDVDFYVLLKHSVDGGAEIGDPSITRVTILDDNDPGEFMFEEQMYNATQGEETVNLAVMREHGFNGPVTLDYYTVNGTAVGGPEIKENVDFVQETLGQLKFEHAETSKIITVSLNKCSEGTKNFIVALKNPTGGAKIGVRSATVVHMNKLVQKTSHNWADELMERVEEVMEDEQLNITWGGQFVQAMTVAAEQDDEGSPIDLKWTHYVMHFFAFFWKIFCAIIPPTSYLGAWPTFVVSLVFIGFMTAVVEQLGKLLGCAVGLHTSVAGITIIALGTSLPDTFASRTAALQDDHADAAIGNITGSNSVNVFLGLGLPWVLKTLHAAIYGYTFKVKTDNLPQSVLIFGIAGTICIITLLVHRKVLGGELGGSFLVKYSMVTLLMGLWLGYVTVISLHAYGFINIPEF